MYNVQYKLKNDKDFYKIENVISDGYRNITPDGIIPHNQIFSIIHYFILEDNTMIEIPMDVISFTSYSKEKLECIREYQKQETK